MAIKSNQHVIKTKNYCKQLHALLQSQVEKELSVRDKRRTRGATPSNIVEASHRTHTHSRRSRVLVRPFRALDFRLCLWQQIRKVYVLNFKN